MTDYSLDAALALTRTGDARFTAHIPEGWQQGRGAFGGLVMGLCCKAMQELEPDAARRLRTLSGEVPAPVLAGSCELSVEVLRRGSSLDSLAVRLTQQGEVRAHATAIFAKDRVADRERLGLAAPPPSDWREVEVLPVQPPYGPDFARGFEYRCTGPLPYSGAAEPRVEGWIRPKLPPAKLGAAELVALIDAYWPTLFAQEEALRPMSTIGFTFQLLMDPAQLDPSQPLRYRATCPASHAGYFVEVRELWTGDGRLIALNPQTFAIIR